MRTRLEKAVEVWLRFVVPGGFLVLGVLGLLYALSMLRTSGLESAGWNLIVASVVVICLSVLVFILSNTRKARRRWRGDIT
ncbi:hypothetical protein GCM10022202_18760 [Microbacterium marinilacus]|uniref:Uncharacterized protein n=2 Tax=Microbacterium marinilacus TaxID=415209 RepID=A0ABP7BEP3_9MICO